MTEAEFKKRIANDTMHLSYSSVIHLLKSPKNFKRYSLRKAKPPTPAMLFGIALHEYILEPEEFKNNFFIVPEGIKKNTKAGKSEYEQIKGNHFAEHYLKIPTFKKIETKEAVDLRKQNTRKYKATPLKQKDFETIQGIRDAFMKVDMCRRFLEGATSLEKFYEIEYKGVKIKMKLDLVGQNYIVDLKTCVDAEYKKFRRDIWNRKYYLQSAIYSLTNPNAEMYLVALDRDFGVSIHFIDQSAIDKGFELLDRAIAKFNESKLLENGFERNIEAYAPENNPYFIFDMS